MEYCDDCLTPINRNSKEQYCDSCKKDRMVKENSSV